MHGTQVKNFITMNQKWVKLIDQAIQGRELLMKLQEVIQEHHIPKTQIEDSMLFKNTPSGAFMMKFCYNFCLEDTLALRD